MKNSINFIKKFNCSSKIYYFIIFLFLFVISACKNSSEPAQSIENNITNLNIIEKISVSHENKPEQIQDENLSENLLDVIELKLNLQEKLKNSEIESAEDFLSAEEIALLSPDDISQYINILFSSNNRNLHQEAIYHIFKSGLINEVNADDIQNLYFNIDSGIYDKDKNRENIKMLYDYAKNLGDTNLLNTLYERSLNIAIYDPNFHSYRPFLLQLSEFYQDDPEKKQEIEFYFYTKNKLETPYETIEKNLENFLKNANQNYDSYNKAIEFLSNCKTMRQSFDNKRYIMSVSESSKSYTKFENFTKSKEHLEFLKNQEKKDENTLIMIEGMEKYLSLYSNIYQQVKETYQK